MIWKITIKNTKNNVTKIFYSGLTYPVVVVARCLSHVEDETPTGELPTEIGDAYEIKIERVDPNYRPDIQLNQFVFDTES